MAILPRNASNSANGFLPLTRTVPAVGSVRPAIMLKIVDLPQPVFAEQGQHLARRNIEVEMIHGAVGAGHALLAEDLGDITEVNDAAGRSNSVSATRVSVIAHAPKPPGSGRRYFRSV